MDSTRRFSDATQPPVAWAGYSFVQISVGRFATAPRARAGRVANRVDKAWQPLPDQAVPVAYEAAQTLDARELRLSEHVILRRLVGWRKGDVGACADKSQFPQQAMPGARDFRFLQSSAKRRAPSRRR